MHLRFLFFVSTLLATLAHANPKQAIDPYDLEDQIREQLENLRSTVRGAIFASFNSIDTIVRDVYYFRNDAMSAAEIAIQQEYQAFTTQVTTLKDLAQSAGYNVDICLQINEPLLDQLPQEIIDTLMECLAFANLEVTIIQNDSRYRIDILMNEVNVFDFQLDLCAGDFLCMSPLVEAIELALVNIPQKIGLIVQEAGDLAEDLKVLIKECTDAKVAQFVTEGGIVVSDISDCIDNIMS